MGACQCFANDLSQFNKSGDHDGEIKSALERRGQISSQTHKLLLLGAGSSGKSTLLKQMRYLYVYHRGYPDEEKQKYKEIVYENIVQILTALCKKCRDFGITNDAENFQYIQYLIDNDVKASMLQFTDELKQGLKSVWDDYGIKQTWERRDEFLIMDNAHYFLSCMARILSDDYIPSFPDVVYTRSRTTGIVTQPFVFENKQNQKEFYEIVDVGGQRTERKKWIQCFNDVVAILFVVALSGYDQVLWEDNKVNRMLEAFSLVNEMVHTKGLNKAQFIVFLNKRDLFQIKIGRVPFRPDGYDGDPHDPQQAMEWIKTCIRNMNTKKLFYFQVTCATDTEDVNRVFLFCHDIIIRKALKQSGLLF